MLKTLVAPAAEREHPHVVITSPSETVNTDLKKTLTQQFKKADVTSALAEEIGLQVKGGVWSFERNLAKDLENLWR
jgi:hypothetical protein